MPRALILVLQSRLSAVSTWGRVVQSLIEHDLSLHSTYTYTLETAMPPNLDPKARSRTIVRLKSCNSVVRDDCVMMKVELDLMVRILIA